MQAPEFVPHGSPPLDHVRPLDPLSFDDGDVILRAEDSDFRVHIVLLRQASPVFRDMFSLPQPGEANDRDVPIIVMQEEARVLDFVLRCIYPLKERPTVGSIEDATKMLDAADKFEIGCVVGLVQLSLTHLLAVEPDPLRSWAIAVRCGHEEARIAAAKRFVKCTSISTLVPPTELAHVNGLQHFNLVQTRMQAFIAAEDAVTQETKESRLWCFACRALLRSIWLDLLKTRNPFSEDLASEAVFKVIGDGSLFSCKSCRGNFETPTVQSICVSLRDRWAKIYESIH